MAERSSRKRYRSFVEDYKNRRLDDIADAKNQKKTDSPPEPEKPNKGKRRQYLREYLRWLWPHRFAVAAVSIFALLVAGLQMIEPLFMRFIIDRVLLNNKLDVPARMV